ncbi:hypothetical protein K469DRAFT_654433 [Zopfia rhizophila CBS 207.26]|uniref:FAD-binding FR-type domain-containing protein n=1 Tax=Zopfia rhizophila CBS 207.26 TaxID=1314779 RepID=A0A6A6ERZ2_9PEZI|nr:hypothetical protein K469DRAFT_654433 [Zopfia rhizophila CBS 207.26]
MTLTQPSAKINLSHEKRTATEPRDRDLHHVILDKITPVGDRIRTFRLVVKDKQSGINFLPGQWLDVHVPGIEEAGGFTITSTPRDAVPRDSSLSTDAESSPFLELAVQKSPENPPAAWLWQHEENILGKELTVRVGGSFVWPPPEVDIDKIKRVVFIAGGVGINPLISMLSHIRQECASVGHVRLLYSTKLPSNNPNHSEILFLPRILDLFRDPQAAPIEDEKDCLELFFTGIWDNSQLLSGDELVHSFNLPGLQSETRVPAMVWFHRINESALSRAIGGQKERRSSVFYVCGPSDMTDHLVEYLREQDDIAPAQVLCEKWW